MKTKFLLIAGILMMTCIKYGFAQYPFPIPLPCPNPMPVVDMQIPSSVYEARTSAFLSDESILSKWEILNKQLRADHHRPHPSSAGVFNADAFVNMLNTIIGKGRSLRVYFGAYVNPGTADSVLSANHEDELVPIFVPTREVDTVKRRHNDDTTEYYVMDHGTGNFSMISRVTATKWVANYLNKIRPLLEKAVFNSNGEPGKETTSLWYDYRHVKAFITKIDCEKQSGMPIRNVILQWGNFIRRDTFYSRGKTQDLDVKSQLTLLFRVPNSKPQEGAMKLDIIRKNLDYAEKTRNLPMKELTALRKFLFGGTGTGDYDTGIPCPPGENCNDDGYSLPIP